MTGMNSFGKDSSERPQMNLDLRRTLHPVIRVLLYSFYTAITVLMT